MSELKEPTKKATRFGGRHACKNMRNTPNLDMLPGLTRNSPLCEVMDE